MRITEFNKSFPCINTTNAISPLEMNEVIGGHCPGCCDSSCRDGCKKEKKTSSSVVEEESNP